MKKFNFETILQFKNLISIKCISPSIHNHLAFTLAEILIVVGIIGIIAESTIPSLISDFQDKVAVTQVKKAYSTLSNAYKLAEQANGTPDYWGLTANPSPTILSTLTPYLNVSKDCSDGRQGCFPPGVDYKYLAPSLGTDGVYDSATYPKLKLADGTLLLGWVSGPACTNVGGTNLQLNNICGEYYVDINGYKNPNQYGKDVFLFWLTKYGIFPAGTSYEGTFSGYTFANYCRDKNTQDGEGCTAWVIYNENRDYLKNNCTDLVWGGKSKCN